jgi:glycosyltransferase involved in cell wall biosynthesis
MKILHIIPSMAAETGGTAVSVSKFCEAQAHAGVDLTLFTTPWPHLENSGDGMIFKSMEKAGVKAKIFPPKKAPLNLPLPHSPQLVEAVRDQGREFDFIINHSLWNPIATGCMSTLRNMGLDYALMPHGMLDPVVFARHRCRKKLWAWAWEQANVEGASLVLFNTPEEERKARNCGWEFKQSFIFPHLLDLTYWKELPLPSLFEAKFPSLQNREVVLFVGRINWVKNLDRLIEAFAMVHARRPGATLVLVGPGIDGAQSDLETQAEKLGVKGDLIFTGLLEGEDLKAAYARGQVLALVSQKENFGLAAAEALAAGLPVVISEGVDLGGNWESGGAVRRVSPYPALIAEAILELLERSTTVGKPDPEAWALAERTWGNSHSSMQQLLETFQKIFEDPISRRAAKGEKTGENQRHYLSQRRRDRRGKNAAHSRFHVPG